jgi:hypothetical protein
VSGILRVIPVILYEVAEEYTEYVLEFSSKELITKACQIMLVVCAWVVAIMKGLSYRSAAGCIIWPCVFERTCLSFWIVLPLARNSEYMEHSKH